MNISDRKQKRAELIERRMGVDDEQRRAWDGSIDAHIEKGFPVLTGMVIGFCWPYKKEYDARFVVKRFRDLGATSALPAVIAKKTPLQFRHWQPGFEMTSGVYGIPVPNDGAVLTPDAVLVPMVAFDNAGFRLGYGGGYFDITLATISPRPLAIGVCYEMFRLKTLGPQPHDIAMDFVVTERGVYAAKQGKLERLSDAESMARSDELVKQRGLPRSQNIEHRS
ncbi:MAG: 5-formyltetrahydrofolate cyclo-ligase [Burkholderiales bacterium]